MKLHTQAGNEVGQHNHTFSVPFSNQAASRGGGLADTVTNNAPFNGATANNAAPVAFNVQQKSNDLHESLFIKL